jgi:TIR domain
MSYRVFISRGWHDRWIAAQMARRIKEDTGAEPFIDIFDIKKGDRIEQRILSELPRCNELVVLLTPWSVRRNWVWTEVGGAWCLGKRVVGVIYGLSISEVEKEHGGMAALAPTNCLGLDEFDNYMAELKVRV